MYELWKNGGVFPLHIIETDDATDKIKLEIQTEIISRYQIKFPYGSSFMQKEIILMINSEKLFRNYSQFFVVANIVFSTVL